MFPEFRAGCCSMRPLPCRVAALQLAVVLSCMFRIALVGADVIVYSQTNGQPVGGMAFEDAPNPFGGSIPSEGLRGLVVYSSPAAACSAIERPPANKTTRADKWIVLIRRCDCTFEEKVRHAEEAGYAAAIIHNVNSSDLDTSLMPGCDPLPVRKEPMSINGSTNITIPSVFVGEETGLIIKDNFQWFEQCYIVINADGPINGLLGVVVTLIIGFSFIYWSMKLLIKMLKCIVDGIHAWRNHPLPPSPLKKMTTRRYKSEDPYETCAVCLEDYLEGDKLRILPCSHAFHCKCIDPWLTSGRGDCPVCKRKFIARDECVPHDGGANRGANGEAPQNQRAVITLESDEIDDERAPLIAPGRQLEDSCGGGTFQNQRENPFLGASRRLRGPLSPAMAATPPPSTTDSSPVAISGSFSSNSLPIAAHSSSGQRSIPVASVVNTADRGASSTWMSVNSSPADVQDVVVVLQDVTTPPCSDN